MRRPEPDQAAIEIAYLLCGKPAPLQTMLANPAQKAALMAKARRHMKQRSKHDPKKLQSNDND